MKIFPSVMPLLAHAQEVKKLRQPEHRGYAQAIRNLLHLDEPGNTPACQSVTGDQASPIEGVWPPVVVLENTLIGPDLDGSLISLTSNELMHMLRGRPFLGVVIQHTRNARGAARCVDVLCLNRMRDHVLPPLPGCLTRCVFCIFYIALGDHGKRRLHPVVKENVLTGQVLVEFPTTHRGWIDANHMHRQFELHARSYEDWLRLKPKFK